MGDLPRRLGLLSAALLVAGPLGGCARTAPPAPVEVKGQQEYVRPPPVPVATMPAHPGTVVVAQGDTLYAIARQYNIPTRAIIDANRLQPPYALRTGQRLTLPTVRTHVVQQGDTVSNLSRRYGVEASSLVRTNGIAPPYHIMAGQTLILPGGAATAPAAPAPRADEPAMTVAAAPPAVPATPVESAPLAAQTSAPVAAAPSSPVAVAPPPQQQEAAPSRNEPVIAAAPPPSVARQAADIEPAAAAAVPARAGRFQWPVRGRVVSDYGPKGGGLQNDGINIAAAHGTPIRAAEHGVVVYAGNELRGFGNLLLLRHADGWMTAYGHANELLVARGDQVKRGQVVARVGSTGNVTTPQLHFEIRRGSRAVNPREHLSSETASSE
jgi:murein DD-endopeptidase MepM/ murein hydrolase activator NlpD